MPQQGGGYALPDPPQMLMAMQGADPTGAFMTEISKGMQSHIQQGIARSMARREQLALKFEELAKNPQYAARQDIVTQASRYAAMLRTIPPGDKMPKEFLPDKKTGGIPAYDQLVLQAHHSAPAKPAQELPPAPETGPQDFDQMFPKSDGGVAGGQQVGPNKISPSPALPAPPPSVLPEGMEPTADPMAVAQQRRQISDVENTITVPGMGDVNKNALPYLGRQQTAAVAMRKLGLKPDGDTIPTNELTPLEQAKIQHLQSQDDLWDKQAALATANSELAKARATGVPEYIKIAQDKVAVAGQAVQVAAQRAQTIGSFFPVVDGQGNIIGGINNKTWDTVGPPKIDGARKTPLAAGEMDKRTALSNTIKNLDERARLGTAHAEKIGFIKGRLAAGKVRFFGDTPEVNELFRLSDDIADQLLRARSGTAITEKEYARLRRLVPDPRSPLSKFFSDLDGFRREVERMQNERASTGAVLPKPPTKATTGPKTAEEYLGRE